MSEEDLKGEKQKKDYLTQFLRHIQIALLENNFKET